MEPRPPTQERPAAVAPRPGLTPQPSQQQLAVASYKVEEISHRDLKAVFEFLDVQGEGVITLAGLKRRLAVIYGRPETVPLADLKVLLGNKKTLSLKDLRNVIDETNKVLEVANLDPIQQAFGLYDPKGTGFVDPALLGEMMERLGYGNLNEEDMKILIETIDADGDGKIGIDDFKIMLDMESSRN